MNIRYKICNIYIYIYIWYMSIWFDILFLAKGIQVPTPSSTRVNSVFSTLVRLASQIVCWSICMFYYLKTLHGPLEGIILLVLMHKNVLTLVTLPSGVVLSYLLPILCVVTLLMFPYFFKTIQLLDIIFYRCSWYYSEGYLTTETFLQHLTHCWESFWGILGHILEFAWGLLPIKNICTKCHVNIVNKEICWASLYFVHFWVFWSILYCFPPFCTMFHLTFLSEFLFIFLFWTLILRGEGPTKSPLFVCLSVHQFDIFLRNGSVFFWFLTWWQIIVIFKNGQSPYFQESFYLLKFGQKGLKMVPK